MALIPVNGLGSTQLSALSLHLCVEAGHALGQSHLERVAPLPRHCTREEPRPDAAHAQSGHQCLADSTATNSNLQFLNAGVSPLAAGGVCSLA